MDPSHQLGAHRVVELFSDRWFMLITHSLLEGPKRFSELLKDIPGVSKRMLTVTLRKMERDGLLTRRVFPVVPPHTEYTLTPLATSLVPHLQELCRWATRHFDAIDAARAEYDLRQGEDGDRPNPDNSVTRN